MTMRMTGAVLASVVLLTGCGGGHHVSGSPVPAAETSAAPSGVPVTDADDAAAISATFDRYRAELLAGNGQGVPALVSPSTIEHYDRVIALAKTAGPEEIAAAGIMDRVMIARLRVETPPAFDSMDGAGLLAYGVDEGMIDASSVEDNRLGEIRVDGDRGYAEMLVDNESSGVDWEFARAGSAWTFDLAAGFPLVNDTLAQVAAENGMTEDEFVFEAVGMVTGMPVDASVYDKP